MDYSAFSVYGLSRHEILGTITNWKDFGFLFTYKNDLEHEL